MGEYVLINTSLESLLHFFACEWEQQMLLDTRSCFSLFRDGPPRSEQRRL